MFYETYYKVVDEDLRSLCLDGNTKSIQYKVDDWVQEPNPQRGGQVAGGIWSFNHLSDAKWLAGYVKTHPNPDIRKVPKVFKIEARGIIAKRHRKSGVLYTVKSLEVRLLEEIEVELNGKYHVTSEQRLAYKTKKQSIKNLRGE